MRTSAVGIELIKKYEGLKLKAYKCPAGVWTIGYGHTRGVNPGDKITPAQAEEYLVEDLQDCEEDVMELVTVPINQNQFDALVSFVYNIGADIDTDHFAEGLGDSTLLLKLNGGDPEGAAREFPKWVYAGGKKLNGLIARRNAERNLFLGVN